MNGKKARYTLLHGRPIVKIKIENPHNTLVSPFETLALVDTGADVSAISVELCQTLGHSFENGTSVASAFGIGSGNARTFAHSIKLTVLLPWDDESCQTFEPVKFQCDFVDQHMTFVLLGQQDFLRLFQYTQNGCAGWFSLEQLSPRQS